MIRFPKILAKVAIGAGFASICCVMGLSAYANMGLHGVTLLALILANAIHCLANYRGLRRAERNITELKIEVLLLQTQVDFLEARTSTPPKIEAWRHGPQTPGVN